MRKLTAVLGAALVALLTVQVATPASAAVASQNFCATTCPSGTTAFSARVPLVTDPTTFHQAPAAFTHNDSANRADTVTATF